MEALKQQQIKKEQEHKRNIKKIQDECVAEQAKYKENMIKEDQIQDEISKIIFDAKKRIECMIKKKQDEVRYFLGHFTTIILNFLRGFCF